MLQLVGARWDDLVSWIVGLLHVIDFRYHLVSIVSIFLALAVGHRARRRPAQGGPGQHADPGARPSCGRTRPTCAAELSAAPEGIDARDAYAPRRRPRW